MSNLDGWLCGARQDSSRTLVVLLSSGMDSSLKILPGLAGTVRPYRCTFTFRQQGWASTCENWRHLGRRRQLASAGSEVFFTLLATNEQ